MTDEEKKLLEQAKRQRDRIKRQNEAAKNNWDCVSIKLPKGTKAAITGSGLSVNGLINELIADYIQKNNIEIK